MNNPFTLLRALILLDVVMQVFGVLIPGFKDESIVDYILSIKDMAGLDFALGLLWVIWLFLLGLSWAGLLACKAWGRYLYVSIFALSLTMSFIRGNSGYGPGIFAVGLELINFYYGFMVCMLFFGPVSVVFKRKSP